jgi:L-iditol 2-dehydrogenase
MAKMRAVQLFAPGDLRCVEVEKPLIAKEADAIIKVKACGVCGSDLMRVMVKGAYRHPITIGHEFSGVIDSIGTDNKGFSPGDRVTVVPLLPCGKCDYCRIGQHVLCDDYSYYDSREDGAMAEYIKVDTANMIKLPSNVDFETGAMTDPVAVALHAVRKTAIEPGQNAAVFGLGAIGLLAVQWLKYSGCSRIYAIDIFDEKLDIAERLGADVCLNAKNIDVVEFINKMTAKRGLDIVIELAGSKITQIQAIEVTRKLGRMVICGISYDDLLIPNAALSRILRGEIILTGAWNSLISPLPVNEWQSSLTFMNSGKIKCNPIISHRFKLEECMKAFDMMFNKKEVFNKVLFKPED